MKKGLFLGLCCLCTTFFYAQEFQFINETINYGKIDKNTDGLKVFEFTNIGKAPLIIKDIKTSCDCAIPEKPERPIMPGEKATITVSYDTSKSGGFSKAITIFSNAKEARKVLKIKGYIKN
ncbi:DUF1573 domain-containing protein [Polaribacter sp.]|uniref:DUF1573 domain-containing protein n=1 Tax=Polaribacter sp. TaxID=1920175 RepID=UPI003EF284F5